MQRRSVGILVASSLFALTLACNAQLGQPPESPSRVIGAVRAATARGSVREVVLTLPSGERIHETTFLEGHQHVLIGRRDANGQIISACVDSPAEAAAFLSGRTGPGARE